MNMCTRFAAIMAALALGLAGCSSKKEEHSDKSAASDDSKQGTTAASPSADRAPEPAMAAEEAMAPIMADGEAGSGYGYNADAVGGQRQAKKSQKETESGLLGSKGGPGGAEQGPAPRAWFPETFLFTPLVVTDDAGRAQLDVRVPDRLTSWRVLGLAHSRSGAQAGTTASFEGTLPAYVDPVVPSFLRAGDTVRVPIQLVNNGAEALQTTLNVEVEGGTLSSKQQPISIAAGRSTVRYVEVRADKPGSLRLMARMGDRDMVVRTIPVLPTGRPVSQSQSGTLASPRVFQLTGAEAVNSSKGIARLSVYPGALALLRSELSASMHRGGMASDAFALLLAGKAPELLRALGDEPDTVALRTHKITATQKVMQHARVLDIASATLIAQAARAHQGDPVLERLAARAMATIESSQAPDGTCGGQDGLTLQRLLVQTADCARAAHDVPSVVIRASGAFERNAKEISDPYTAAAILAAGGATGALADTLRALVLEAIEDTDNGAKVLSVPGGVLRADGQAPGRVEATALAILALRDHEGAPLADLGATILASYSPQGGWGDGRANLVCMEAATLLFRDPLPETITITLREDDQVVAEGILERSKVREVLELAAEGLDIGGAHSWTVSAEPAVPGLGFSLGLTSWVPWTAETTLGTELVIDLPKTMKVGEAALVGVQAIAPSGMPFTIEMALPAGAVVDRHALDLLVQANSLERYQDVDGRVTLHVRALAAAQRFSAAIRVIPTLGGALQSGPTSIAVAGQRAHLPPSTWTIR